MAAATKPAAVRLPASLDLSAAAPLADELLRLRGRPVTIDASDVERVGALCLQVLLSAQARWELDGAPFAVARPSLAFSAALDLSGAHALDERQGAAA